MLISEEQKLNSPQVTGTHARNSGFETSEDQSDFRWTRYEELGKD